MGCAPRASPEAGGFPNAILVQVIGGPPRRVGGRPFVWGFTARFRAHLARPSVGAEPLQGGGDGSEGPPSLPHSPGAA